MGLEERRGVSLEASFRVWLPDVIVSSGEALLPSEQFVGFFFFVRVSVTYFFLQGRVVGPTLNTPRFILASDRQSDQNCYDCQPQARNRQTQ